MDLKLTTSDLITIVSTVIPPIAPVPIVDAPPISAGELPEVATPIGRRGSICNWGWCSTWKKKIRNFKEVNISNVAKVHCDLGKRN